MASTNNPRKRKKLEQSKKPAQQSSRQSVKQTDKSSDGRSAEQTKQPVNQPVVQPTSSRPSVKSKKKISAGQSGSLSGSFDISNKLVDNKLADGASSRTSGRIADAGISGSIDFSNFQEKYGNPDEAAVSEGAMSAAEFLREKQDERELAKERERKRDHRRRILKRVALAIIFLIVAVVVAVVVAFSVFRWHTYDDHADMQGVWRVAGTDAQVTISEDVIKLTDDVAYKYVIDPDSKTIQFTFGNLVGQGHYRFSLDRQSLSIMDGEYDWGQTLSEDIKWTIDALMEQIFDNTQMSPSGDSNVTELEK